MAPRRTSSRVLQKMRQDEENRKSTPDVSKDKQTKEKKTLARNNRAKYRDTGRPKSASSDSRDCSTVAKVPKKHTKKKQSGPAQNGAQAPIRNVRKTNNSLASATFQSDQIVIPENDEPVNSTRKKLKTSQIFSQTDEDIRTDMYKVIKQLMSFKDAWPFLDPVDEEYAPNYYSIIRRPMNLNKMEDKLNTGYYTNFDAFKADFTLIVNNCQLYNGQDNEYTSMVIRLQNEFSRLTEKYMYHASSSDEEIAVEYQLPSTSRRQKRKVNSSPSLSDDNNKTQNTQLDNEEAICSSSNVQELIHDDQKTTNGVSKDDNVDKVNKGSSKGDKVKRRGTCVSKKSHDKLKKRRRHGKNSRIHKKKLRCFEKKRSKKPKQVGVEEKSQQTEQNDTIVKPVLPRVLDMVLSQTVDSLDIEEVELLNNIETEELPDFELRRSGSRESLASSNYRSASPLPSIYTPSLSYSPVYSDDESGPYIAKESVMWNSNAESLRINYDTGEIKKNESTWTNDSSNESMSDSTVMSPSENKKEKNHMLRETIAKLKTKNRKYRDTSSFSSLFSPRSVRRSVKKPDYKEDSEDDFSEDEALENLKSTGNNKKSSTKNRSTSQALEEAVKDISKWLNEIPERSPSSPHSSTVSVLSATRESGSRHDDELSAAEKAASKRKDLIKKRLSSREPKLVKRRDIQLTIDRLQPGKSKGNLLTNVPKSDKVDDNSYTANTNSGDSNQNGKTSPKLNLGSVLPTVNFSLPLIQDLNKYAATDEIATKGTKSESAGLATTNENLTETATAAHTAHVEEENKVVALSKPNKEKAIPNLSAWFKAFGVPKTAGPANCTKKKPKERENEEKPMESEPTEVKASSKLNSIKVDSPNSPIHDGGDSSHASLNDADAQLPTTGWRRRTSTGSSISEQSSFSQDLDSPRQQIAHNSPLLRSPASPRSYDDFQKSYSISNGSVRAGFYQDTTSVRGSPDKICSPREAPHSPYSPCPQHVYASASAAQAAATPLQYFVDPNKSPVPTTATPTYNTTSLYFDTTKTSLPIKTSKQNDALTVPSVYSAQPSCTEKMSNLPSTSAQAQKDIVSDAKTIFPVKKRIYNEREQWQSSELPPQQLEMAPCVKLTCDTLTTYSTVNSIIKCHTSFINKIPTHPEDSIYDNNNVSHMTIMNVSGPSAFEMKKKHDIHALVNMYYPTADEDRHETFPDMEFLGTEANAGAANTAQRYESVQVSPVAKAEVSSYNVTPAHSHERHTDANTSKQPIANAHQGSYDPVCQQGGLSCSDIESPNKKLCTFSITQPSLDYGSQIDTNETRTQDHLPIDFSYINSSDKVLQKPKLERNYTFNCKDTHKTEIKMPSPAPTTAKQPPQKTLGLNFDVQPIYSKISHHSMFAPSLPYNNPYVPHSMQPIRTVNDNLYLPGFTNPLYPNKQLENQVFEKATATSSPITYSPDSQLFKPDRGAERDRRTPANTAFMFNACSSRDNNTLRPEIRSSFLRPASRSSVLRSDFRSQNLPFESRSLLLRQGNRSSLLRPERKSPVLRHERRSSLLRPDSRSLHLRPERRSPLSRPNVCDFNSANSMTLNSMYGNDWFYDNGSMRSNTDQLMAANYMAAAVATQRNNGVPAEKLMQPGHQSGHNGGTYPFMAHPQLRSGYPFVDAEATSPLYQQYIQRYQDMQRQTEVQLMGLYPPAYAPSLGGGQPYDSTDAPTSK